MKRFRYLLITALFIDCLSVAVSAEQKTTDAEQLNSVHNVRDAAEYTYPTKFGDVQLVRADGKPGEPADNITLNGELLLSTKGQIDKQGELLFLTSESQTTSSCEKLPRRTGQIGKTETTRMGTYGPDMDNCVGGYPPVTLRTRNPAPFGVPLLENNWFESK